MASWKSSAAVGALVVQVVYLALEVPTYQAAWGWQLDVPTGMGFTCKEGKVIGGGQGAKQAAFDCTVTPDAGKQCDITKISVVCSAKDKAWEAKHPPSVKCINIGHKCEQGAYAPNGTMTTCKTVKAGETNDDDSELSWSQVPKCSTPTTAGKDNVSKASSTGISLAGFLIALGIATASLLR